MEKHDIEELLTNHPKGRSRIHKNLALGWLLKERYGLALPNEVMAELIGDVLNIDRYWRLVMSEHPEWQDEVYWTKDIVEQEKELELGFEPGFTSNVKLLKGI